MSTLWRCIILFVFALGLSSQALASALPEPTGRVILTILDSRSQPKLDSPVELDINGIESVGRVDFTSTIPWADGAIKFSGVEMVALLRALGVDSANTLRTRALDDYSVEIPVSDFDKYDVKLATRVDSARIRIRDNGPLRIIYPDDKADHDSPDIRARMTWQIVSFELLD